MTHFMENAGPPPKDTTFIVGDRVQVDEEHEVYPAEMGEVLGSGTGMGLYSGHVIYDVQIEGGGVERFIEDDLHPT